MKYFTKEMWAGWQSSRTRARADRTFERGWTSYTRQLARLKKRLGRDYEFFTHPPLHDGTLVSFSAGDLIGKRLDPRLLRRRMGAVAVEIRVVEFSKTRLHLLKYSEIKRIKFDFPTDEPLFLSGTLDGWLIHDWGYDELTSTKEGNLRHEILFASGTTIEIVFGKFTHKIERIK